MSHQSNNQSCLKQECRGEGEALTSRGDNDSRDTRVQLRRDRIEEILANREQLTVRSLGLSRLYDCGIRGTETSESDTSHMWWLGFCSAVELIAMEADD